MNFIKKTINFLLIAILSLRYRVTIKGLGKIEPDERPIIFLANHPALIDPVIIMSRLYYRFQPRPLADEAQLDKPLFRNIGKMVGAIIIPDLARGGKDKLSMVNLGIQEVVSGLKQGDNILLYPGGRLMQRPEEDLRANSAVKKIISSVDNVRIVMIRSTGLWGSDFSRANGVPALMDSFGRRVLMILANGILFMPRRPVRIDVVEADDFPRHKDKMVVNRYLEQFFNGVEQPRLFVPSFFWQGDSRILEEPEPVNKVMDTSLVAEHTRILVLEKIRELAGVGAVRETDHLARDLAMDSLLIVEFGAYLNEEFGVSDEHLDGLNTVADCILAAGGFVGDAPSLAINPPGEKWFVSEREQVLDFPEGTTVAEIFLAQARKYPGQVIVTDQISGEKTYRQLVMGILALLPGLKKIPGERVGIMMPATVAAVFSYLGIMFAGREPVMVNWTTGVGQVSFCLKNCRVSHVLTSKKLLDRLKSQGFDADGVGVEWVFLEDIAGEISFFTKLRALVGSRFDCHSLGQAKIAETAAILFTSGSETHPKSVPLSHENFLANVRDFNSVLELRSSDRLLGILPVFHSLGLAGTVILPLCTGLRTVYWPNPTEGRQLARMVAAYKASLFITTPTFLQNIIHQAEEGELASLRLVFSGAEKCPDSLFDRFFEHAPSGVLCEGYGVTECSPVITVNTPQEPAPGTIGRLFPSMEAAVVHHEGGGEVEAGKPGRLLVRGPNVFAGYIGDVPSPFVSHDGRQWYDTGDLVTCENGLFRFAGRLKRFVKLGGEMISLPAIEEVLINHLGDDKTSEPELAVLAAGEERPELILLTIMDISRQQANDALKKAGMSPLHNIRMVKNIEKIPVLGSGKIDYRQLQEMVKG